MNDLVRYEAALLSDKPLGDSSYISTANSQQHQHRNSLKRLPIISSGDSPMKVSKNELDSSKLQRAQP